MSEKLKGRTISKEQCEKHSEAMKGEGNPNYGKPWTEERKNKLRETRRIRNRNKAWDKLISELVENIADQYR